MLSNSRPVHANAMEQRLHFLGAEVQSTVRCCPKMKKSVEPRTLVEPPPRGVKNVPLADAQALLDRPLDMVDLDEPSPFVDYLLRSGELQHVG